MFAWVATLQISLGLAQHFQGLSGSIGSNPERRFLQETYRLESQGRLTGAASKWEAYKDGKVGTSSRHPNDTSLDCFHLETIFPIQATRQTPTRQVYKQGLKFDFV